MRQVTQHVGKTQREPTKMIVLLLDLSFRCNVVSLVFSFSSVDLISRKKTHVGSVLACPCLECDTRRHSSLQMSLYAPVPKLRIGKAAKAVNCPAKGEAFKELTP